MTARLHITSRGDMTSTATEFGEHDRDNAGQQLRLVSVGCGAAHLSACERDRKRERDEEVC